jgi:C4-dicarboxylate-specific signal transduction histidine kinase
MVALSGSGASLKEGGLERLTRSGVTEVGRLARAIVEAEREHDELLRREAQVETEMLRKELAHVGRVSVMGQLSASLAHEVNQPLCAIALNAEAVRRTLDGRAPTRFDMRAALDDIVLHSRRASAIIGRMRALFRNETTERRPLDVNATIGDVTTLVHGEVARHGIALSYALDASLPPVQGDVVQLQQVMLNLLVNACEALEAAEAGQRALTITTARREPGHVEISVRDTGPGVAGHDTERLFAPFVTSKPNGLGMGLAICRSIVESHGGRIWATRNDDRGLTVHVVLPVEGIGAPAPPRPVPVADGLSI